MKQFWAWLSTKIHQLGSPAFFYDWSGRLIPIFGVIALATLSYGLIGGLFLSPPDYQQGDAFRIIYVHVPSAFLSLTVYAFMAVCALIALVWQIKLADMALQASTHLGAWFTFAALITGALWGKPMWGTWWVWDARLTSELILLFLYLGVMALRHSLPDRRQAMRACALLTLVGVVNLPVIHYSVYWWNTLHQGATLSRLARPTIDNSMLYPLLSMIAGFLAYFITAVLLKTRVILLEREANAQWIRTRMNIYSQREVL